MAPAAATERFPLGAALRLAELEAHDNAPLLHALREREPVSWFAEQGVWLVTSRALFDEVMMDPRRFVVDVPGNPQGIVLGRMMLAVDEPEHSRHRAPFAEPFKHGEVRARFSELLARRADELLRARKGGGACELAAAYANPFAISVASDVLGLGLEHVEEVHEIYGAFATGMVGYLDEVAVGAARDASARLHGFLEPAVERLRARPDGSVLSAVLHAGGRALAGDEELYANLRVILFGAIETVESMILNTTWALCRHPAERARLDAEPSLWPAAVAEGLRWVPPVGYTDRWASEDTLLGGVEIARGDYLVPVIASANRDPAAFPDPDRFDVGRSERRQHHSFGRGIHMCLGVNLARLQGLHALRALFEQLPGLRLDADDPVEPVGFNFRRPPRLRVRWDA
jgi:cytochrome P450